MSSPPDEVLPEDQKLITLARSARARIGATSGAAVRDETGRTYTGVDVRTANLSLSAVDLAVAQAIAAGARTLEAIGVVSTVPELPLDRLAVARDLAGEGVPVFVAGPDGSCHTRATT